MNTFTFWLRLLLLCTFFAVPAVAVPPIIEACEHLEKAQALLEQPKVVRPNQYEAALSRHLTQALSNFDQAKENKGSQLSLAIKATQKAQEELKGGVTTTSREAALAAVKDALDRCEKMRKFR